MVKNVKKTQYGLKICPRDNWDQQSWTPTLLTAETNGLNVASRFTLEGRSAALQAAFMRLFEAR